jgi:hypothetical protein
MIGLLYQVFSETGILLDYLTGIRGLSESLRLPSSSQQNLYDRIPEEADQVAPVDN